MTHAEFCRFLDDFTQTAKAEHRRLTHELERLEAQNLRLRADLDRIALYKQQTTHTLKED